MAKISCFIHVNVTEKIVLNPFLVQLLTAIQASGSLQQAAKLQRVSYQHAWNTIKQLNCIAPLPVVELKRGGEHGGGAAISMYGNRILQEYANIERLIQKTVNQIETEMAM
ncbi:MAG TPA: hypothetical protein PLS12_09925 [Bacteroidales bacterium]|nr:hypothetical protein [Bacteroidales bacterium]